MIPSWRPIAAWLAFQVVWLACALGAAQGRTAPGVIAAALFIGAALLVKRPLFSELRPILAAGLIGVLAESVLVSAGLVRFAAPWPSSSWAPAWIVALWLAFGAVLPAIARLLGDRLAIKAGIVGLFAGPSAYWAGERLGALEITGPGTYLAIATIWSLALPSLLIYRSRVAPACD